MTDHIYVGVDVGGSGMRVQTIAGDVRRSGHDELALQRFDGQIDIGVLAERIGHLVADVLGAARRISRLAVGTTGIPGLIERPENLSVAVGRRVDARTVIVASDALTSHIGALDGAAGSIIAAGTGAIALGTDHARIWNQADGWGYLLGDRGSGAWVGMRGLEAALNALDHRRGGSSVLLDLAMSAFGSADQLLSTVYRGESAPRVLAGFAPKVAQAARLGDLVAADIWEAAARHLASAVYAAGRNLPPLVSWGGRLFAAGELITAPFHDEVEKLRPGTRVVAPVGQSADGALALAVRGIDQAGNASRFVRTVDISAASSADQWHPLQSAERKA